MSAKAVIKNLDDSQLLKIFMDFVRKYNLQYDKIHKEISYKCFEATWIITNVKATGYGRTQTQAYKNGLKNLIELFMEDQIYHQYFTQILFKKKRDDVERISTPPKNQLKTELYENQQKIKVQYDNYSKINYLSKSKQQIHHSKINLNKNMGQNIDGQIQKAKDKFRLLQAQLNRVLDQNKVLRQRLNQSNNKYKASDSSSKIEKNYTYAQNHNKDSKQNTQNFTKQTNHLQTTTKLSVPKLNLQILPNYHKKSQKCLNNILLAAYNQKRKNAS